MESLGVDLKCAREKGRLDLKQVAKDTHIAMHYLKSLEEGHYTDLPGGMYNRAFLRSYCEYLKLDPVPMLQRYEEEHIPQSEKTLKVHSPQQVSLWKPSPLLIWSIMLLVSTSGLYFSRHWIALVFSPYFSHSAPSPLISGSPSLEPIAPTPASMPSETLSPTAPASAESEPALPDTKSSDSTTTESPTPSAPASEINKLSAITPKTFLLEFEVLQECWVSLSSDGTRVLSDVLRPGFDKTFDANNSFYLILGNAGGVRLKINGEMLKPLGKPGEVIKLTINAQSMKDLLEKTSG